VPPKNLKNPTRAGQANDSSHIERMLARSRTVPDAIYDQRIEKILDRHIANYEERFGPMPSEDARKAEKERIQL